VQELRRRRRLVCSTAWPDPLEVVNSQSPLLRSKPFNLRGAQIIFQSNSTVYDKIIVQYADLGIVKWDTPNEPSLEAESNGLEQAESILQGLASVFFQSSPAAGSSSGQSFGLVSDGEYALRFSNFQPRPGRGPEISEI